AAPAPAGVVINEILYHAPDDLDNLQFIELHNPGDNPVDLSGWKLTRAISFEFPAGTQIEPGGYLALCKDAALFRKYYGFDAGGGRACRKVRRNLGGRRESATPTSRLDCRRWSRM